MALDKSPFTLFEDFEKHPRTKQPKKRSLMFDINALADFEQETGMGFGQLMSTKAMFATTRAMMWAGLKHEDRTLTTQDVGVLLTKYVKSGGSINDVLKEALKAAAEQGALGKDVAENMANEEEGDGGGDDPSTIDVTPTRPVLVEAQRAEPTAGETTEPAPSDEKA